MPSTTNSRKTEAEEFKLRLKHGLRELRRGSDIDSSS